MQQGLRWRMRQYGAPSNYASSSQSDKITRQISSHLFDRRLWQVFRKAKMEFLFGTYLKLFLLLAPPFILSVFLAMTRELDGVQRRKTAVKVTGAVMIISSSLYLFGRYLFAAFGITLDAFRIGAGVLLFLAALALTQGTPIVGSRPHTDDIAVVPLALPMTVGPATTGALVVLGAEATGLRMRLLALISVLCAVMTVGAILYVSGMIERLLGQKGLLILSKLTGLILASLAAQMIFTGIANLLPS